ncbi:FeoA domain-containing protein [Humidesulfovibrio sp.]
MEANLAHAPCEIPLTLTRVADAQLEAQLGRMGIHPGSEVTRLDEEVALNTVRVRGPKGEVLLGGGMGGKVVVHLDGESGCGSMVPLTELSPGQAGHIEAVTGGESLAETLAALGLKNDDRIEMVRALPPMEYVASLSGRGRVRLAEGMAAKMLGRMGAVECQFANAQAGAQFTVTRILGGERARRAIAALGIGAGDVLTLDHVAKAASYRLSGGDRVVLSSREGLRLFLRRDQADLVIVRWAQGDAAAPSGEAQQ